MELIDTINVRRMWKSTEEQLIYENDDVKIVMSGVNLDWDGCYYESDSPDIKGSIKIYKK